jgi:hypothetical protein
MTAKDYKEIIDYKCDHDCEHCKYRAWLGDDWGCKVDIMDLTTPVHDDEWF